jgi:hypothetical protein
MHIFFYKLYHWNYEVWFIRPKTKWSNNLETRKYLSGMYVNGRTYVWALVTGVGGVEAKSDGGQRRPKIERGAAFCCHRTCMQTKGAFFSQSDRQALSFLDRSLIVSDRSLLARRMHSCMALHFLICRPSSVHPNLLGSWNDVQIWLICVCQTCML